jgi:hypothetical protein
MELNLDCYLIFGIVVTFTKQIATLFFFLLGLIGITPLTLFTTSIIKLMVMGYNYTDATYAPYGRQYWSFNQSFNGVSGANGYIRGASNTFIMELYIPDNTYNWSGTFECLDSTYLNGVGSYAKINVIST